MNLFKKKRSKLLLLGSILIIMALILTSCGDNKPQQQAAKETGKTEIPKKLFSIGSGPTGSLFVNFTATWADIISKSVPGMVVNVEVGGSSQNMQNIHNGNIDFGITSTLQTYQGLYGIGWAKGVKYDKVMAFFPSYSYEGVFLTKANSPISTIRDINGKNISLGYAGSGSDVTGRELLKYYNITPKNIVNGSWEDVGGMLRDGLVDCIFYLAGHPAGFIQELEISNEIKYITISDEDINAFLKDNAYYNLGTLPAGTYKYMKEPYKAFQGWNFIAITPDLPADFVYELTKATWENIEPLQKAHKSFVQTSLDNVQFMNLPLHPGAEKYYKEKNVKLPTVPAPPK